MCASQLKSLNKVIPSSLKVVTHSITPDCVIRHGRNIGCLARQPRTISFDLFRFMIILLACDHVLRVSTCCTIWLFKSPLARSSDEVVSSTYLWTRQVRTFIYRHWQGNPNSSGLQFEEAYWPALAEGGTAQLAAAHCLNERTLDPQ